MSISVSIRSESGATKLALVRLVARVNVDVVLEMLLQCETPRA